ncbi:AbiH family protein [Acinetobacter sp. YH12052]|uniref:AbiH family protein n=1 Tax=Acinetobacter sp. YH12052 TaxID=2601055 RepID=UPI0015D27F4B|nr:AbiH family protein [Acinetobacter sp. YH12052]
MLGILTPLVSEFRSNTAFIRKQYYRSQNTKLDIDFNLIINDLEIYLNDFISIFKWYLQEVVQKLEQKHMFDLKAKSFEFDDLLVLSFNYTSTFSHFYSTKAKVEYVHGQVGKDLVLGIPDLKNEFLKKFKNYSFTKYHQKLLKDTDYLFLDENPKIKSMFESRGVGQRRINIYIWGHSLADSDENYIHEIFSLNRKESVECRVVVYFYENDAPTLLNNLLDILDKDIIEKWMKKGWLKFEKNLEIDFGINEESVNEQQAS